MTQAASPGRTLGRYELLMPLAKGGMAQVWAARLRGTRGFQKIVAIKTILADAMDGARAEQMFLEEATLASHIHHPNVVGTLELGEHEGTLYLVMEWVNGEALSQILMKAGEAGGVPLPLAVNLIVQACSGLHAAHEARDEGGELLGIVHRDVSPHNVLVTYQGTAKLVDFGIAKATSRASDLTNQGELKGKFAYMAPEQITGAALDRRADVFGMGVLLYALTTGTHPFRGKNAAETLRNICVKAPAAPSSHLAGYPLALEDVVLRALAKAPEERFATAHDLLVALETAVPESVNVREPEVAAYLKELFGSRSSERMSQLRQAQQAVDANGPSSSNSSLRAVSIDRPVTSSDVSSLEISYTAASLTDVSAKAPTKPVSRKLVVASLLGGVALLGLALLAWQRGVREPRSAATLAPPVTELRAAQLPVASTLAVNPPLPAAAPVSAEPEKEARAVRPQAHKVVSSAPPKVMAVASAAPTAVPHTAGEASGARKPNAWDADNYGGRR